MNLIFNNYKNFFTLLNNFTTCINFTKLHLLFHLMLLNYKTELHLLFYLTLLNYKTELYLLFYLTLLNYNSEIILAKYFIEAILSSSVLPVDPTSIIVLAFAMC